jgi:hypothetical protein
MGIVYGIWGGLTVILALLLFSYYLRVIQSETAAAIAHHKQQLAETNYQQIHKVLTEILDRPSIAQITDQQIQELAQNMYNRIVDIKSALSLRN